MKTLLLHHYYVIIVSLLLHYSPVQKQVMMSSLLCIMYALSMFSLLDCYYPLLPILPIFTIYQLGNLQVFLMEIFLQLIMNWLSLNLTLKEIISGLRLNSQSWKIMDRINAIILCIMFGAWMMLDPEITKNVFRGFGPWDYEAKVWYCDSLHCFMFHDKKIFRNTTVLSFIVLPERN